MVRVVGAVERLRRRGQISTKCCDVLIQLPKDEISSVQPQFERLGRLRAWGANLILVTQQELPWFGRSPRAILLPHAIAGIRGRLNTFDWRLRDRIGITEMLSFGPNAAFMRERHRILYEPDLDASSRVHFGT